MLAQLHTWPGGLAARGGSAGVGFNGDGFSPINRPFFDPQNYGDVISQGETSSQAAGPGGKEGGKEGEKEKGEKKKGIIRSVLWSGWSRQLLPKF